MSLPARALGNLGELPLEVVELILRHVGDTPGRLTHKHLHDLDSLCRTNQATHEFIQDWITREVKKIKIFPSAQAALDVLSDEQKKAIEPPGSPKFVPTDALSEAVIEDCTSCVDRICDILDIPGLDRADICNEQGWSLLSLSIHCAETYRSLIYAGLVGSHHV
jgi:hypothetical protein